MKTVIVVQARMTSTRLPGKILKPVLDKPLLEYQSERLKRVKKADEIVIATTTNDTDLPIVEFCQKHGLGMVRGSEEDVLSRYYLAATTYQATDVVRITSDCPLIDPGIVDQVIGFYLDNRDKYDYVSNTLIRSYPRGMDTEVFSMEGLTEANAKAEAPAEREHVTPYFYLRPERFRLHQIVAEQDWGSHRWTVDTEEDYQLIKNILEALYPGNPYFTMNDVLKLLELNPEWVGINAHIIQKSI